MATRNIVPRATGEGGIGTAAKKWALGWINALVVTTLNALTLTAQAVGFTISGGTTSKTLTVSDTMTLALGAANLKQFMNAGATAPEWAAGFKIGSFTRNLTADAGDVAYTGVGFKPSVVVFATITAGITFSSVGFDDGTNHFCFDSYTSGAVLTTLSVTLRIGITTWGRAFVKTMDSDGFTLTWSKSGTPSSTETVFYLALR